MTFTGFVFWFGAYLLIGLTVLLILWLIASLQTTTMAAGEVWMNMVKAYDDVRHQRISLATFAEKVLMLPAIFLIWPVSMAIVIYLLYEHRRVEHWVPNPEDAFTCHRKHLVARLTPEAAELLAPIVDPLGRVPDVPFGHLNGGWRALLADQQDGDELWSFEVPGYAPGPETPPSIHRWAVPRGAKRGYAVVACGKVKADFVCEWD
jgi:hypothetical protein